MVRVSVLVSVCCFSVQLLVRVCSHDLVLLLDATLAVAGVCCLMLGRGVRLGATVVSESLAVQGTEAKAVVATGQDEVAQGNKLLLDHHVAVGEKRAFLLLGKTA